MSRALTPAERLWAAVMVQAINDGAMKDPPPPKKERPQTLYDYRCRLKEVQETREEARDFVRMYMRDKPKHLRFVEAYWANPFCDTCGTKVYWPTTRCYKCKELEERDGMDQETI